MEVDRRYYNKLCRTECIRNSRRVFRLPRRSIKDASVARFASLSLSPHKPNSGENPRKGAAAPFLVVLRGFAKGQGSHANPAKRFVWEKEEQRNGRGLSAASGGQDEGCGVCSDATPPLPFSFYRQRLFLCRAKKKGLNAFSDKPEKSMPPEAFRTGWCRKMSRRRHPAPFRRRKDMARGAADAASQTAPRLRRIRKRG